MMDLAVSTRDDIWYECTSFATQRTSSKIMWRIWPWMYSTVVKRQDKEVFDVNSLVKTLGNELQVRLCEGFDHGCTVQNIDAQSCTGVVRKSRRGSSTVVFYCIFMTQFFKVFCGGTWGSPLLPLSTHVYIYGTEVKSLDKGVIYVKLFW